MEIGIKVASPGGRGGIVLKPVISIKNVDLKYLDWLVKNFDKFARKHKLEKGTYYIQPNVGGKYYGFRRAIKVVYDG